MVNSLNLLTESPQIRLLGFLLLIYFGILINFTLNDCIICCYEGWIVFPGKALSFTR